MKERRRRSKGVVVEENDLTMKDYNNNYYSASSDLPCNKHPSSSSVGICAYCLKDRLVKLVCSDCGEQRLSSCSCSEISSNRNSCTVEVGSVGRVSFLIENEKSETLIPNSKPKSQEKPEEFLVLKRSSSNSVDVKRNHTNSGGFWRIGRFFRKRSVRSVVNGGFDEKSDTWMADHGGGGGGGVSRSRSLCSFRNGGLFGSEDGGDNNILSGARSSISAARSSGVNGGLFLESGRRSGYSEAEPRRSGYDGGERRDSGMDAAAADGGIYGVSMNRRVFSLRESDFKGMDESRFIDLKLDFSSESKSEFASAKMMMNCGNNNNNLADQNHTLSAFGSTRVQEGGDGDLGIGGGGGSCRITVNDRGIKRGRRSMKGWRWIFRHSNPSGKKKDEDDDVMFRT